MSTRTIALTVTLVVALVSSMVIDAAPVGGFSEERLLNVRSTLQSAVAGGELPGVITVVWPKGEPVQLNALGWRDIEFGAIFTSSTLRRSLRLTAGSMAVCSCG